MKALITGVNGFAASHLAELLLSEGWDVHGTLRARSNTENIAPILSLVTTHVCDVTDAYSVKEVIQKVEPDVVFHLAAQSFVPLSWKAPQMTLDTNVGGTINILEAVRTLPNVPIVHISSSSQVYGSAEPPFTLDTPFKPMNPYDVSKLAQEMYGVQYWRSYGIPVRITRAFNLTGPRRQDFMVDSSFAKQVALCEAGKQDEIKVGNLEATRDFVDVRDVVRAYLTVVEKGEDGGVYIVASGVERSIQSVLDGLIELASVKPKVVVDPDLLRPSDTPRMKGDASSMERIGWKPVIPFEQSLSDLLGF